MSKMVLTGIAASFLITPAIFAGAEEEEAHNDVWVFVEDGRIKTGSADVDESIFETHVRVFESELGEVTPNFTDEPGFFSQTLTAGTTIGFNIVDSLRVWNGTDFNTTASVDMTLWQAFGIPGSPSSTTPGSPGTEVGGFDFATADALGMIDDHPDFVLNAPATDGIYLLTLELTSPGLDKSLPIFLVLNQNMSEEMHEAAAEYAEANVPAPGTAALAGVAALGLVRRRR